MSRIKLPDKRILVAAGLVVALLALLGGLVAVRLGLGRLDRTIAARTQALSDIGQWRGEAILLQQQIAQAEGKLSRGDGGASIALVEGMVNRVSGPGSLVYLRPQATSSKGGVQMESVELKVERQSLEQLLRLLWEFDSTPAAPMHVANLRLQRRFESPALLDATLTVHAYRK